SGRTLGQRPLQAAASVISAIASSATRNGRGSPVPSSSATQAIAAETVGVQTTEASLRFQASAAAQPTKPARTPAAVPAGITWKRRVSSHNIGGRITAAVVAYAVLAKMALGEVRAAHTTHIPAYA